MNLNKTFWYKNAIFYELYVRAFYDGNNDGHGDLQGLTQKLEYLQELGVDCLWVLPTFPSPLVDDGYDISDYYGVLPEYGTIYDFKSLISEVHHRGMRIIIDLVINHTSDQHPWFQAARADRESKYRDYYVWSDTDQKYQDARIIFLDTESSNWTWDEMAGQYYWHRFYASQPDLNYDNPAVKNEMLNVASFWLEMGIDGFRVDAVPYLYEREGTNCENLPETHQFLKEFRQFIDQNYPDAILLCEANQWPEDVRPYFGDGDEFHIGFHFPVMPRLYMALRREDVTPLTWIMDRTPAIPENCQWCIFLRNHDELTLEMVTEEERQWMWQEYAPDPRMRLNLGIRRRLAPLVDNDQRKIELLNSLLFTLPGSPIIYYGDEIGMGDNIWLPDRNGVRTPMQWDTSLNAGFSRAEPEQLYSPINSDELQKVNIQYQQNDPASLWHKIQQMIAVRKAHPVLGSGDLVWVNTGKVEVAGYIRNDGNDHLFILNNLSGKRLRLSITLPTLPDLSRAVVILGKDGVSQHGDQIQITLDPYQYSWIRLS